MNLLFVNWHVNPILLRMGSLEIRWYGLLFVAGFILGWYLFKWFFKREKLPLELLDSLLYTLLIATIVGARLGHCIFYQPDYYFGSVFDITPEFLLSAGIKAVVLDIDNTLVTYGEAEPSEKVISWVSSLTQAKIKAAIASNNNEERVKLFNRRLGIFCVSKSGKPSVKAVSAACKEFSASPQDTAVIGDQIFTDVLCANRAGAVAILTKPIPYRENLFFRFKRALEKPIIKSFERKHPDRCFPKGECAGK